jgi:hypothetical protein
MSQELMHIIFTQDCVSVFKKEVNRIYIKDILIYRIGIKDILICKNNLKSTKTLQNLTYELVSLLVTFTAM